MSHIVVDFSRLDKEPPPAHDDPAEPASPSAPATSVTGQRIVTRRAGELAPTPMEALMPSIDEAVPSATAIPLAKVEAAKASFIASGGNIAEVARQHSLKPETVTRLASEHQWPVYGNGYTDGEKSRRTSLQRLASLLEQQMFDLGSALGVERKDIDDIVKNGTMSAFVAPLNQRSQAFATVFDRYMRVMTLLEPELFAADTDPSNPVAARLRQQSPDSPGGLEGIDRKMADFAARVAVSTLQAHQQANTHTIAEDDIVVEQDD